MDDTILGNIIADSKNIYGALHQSEEMTNCLKFLSDKQLNGFIEVGCASGASFHCWASVVNGLKLSVDLNHGFGMSEGLGGANTKDDVLPAAEQNYTQVRDRNNKWRRYFSDVYTIEGNSMAPETIEKVKSTLNGKKVDWIFIDAWHEYFAAMEDLNNFKQFLSADGYIGFHDIHQSASMDKFWSEVQNTYTHTIEISGGTGIGLIHASSFI
jgi:hypothetical protein